MSQNGGLTGSGVTGFSSFCGCAVCVTAFSSTAPSNRFPSRADGSVCGSAAVCPLFSIARSACATVVAMPLASSFTGFIRLAPLEAKGTGTSRRTATINHSV